MAAAAQPPRLLDRLRESCRVRHYSIRTEDAYHDWCERFIVFHGKTKARFIGQVITGDNAARRAEDIGG